VRFLDELDRAFDAIGRNPMHYLLHDFGTRRLVLRRFPFVIVFREAANGVEIIAIAHGRRRPGYWRDRLG
jgi:plasmid stabilization system protein ParE